MTTPDNLTTPARYAGCPDDPVKVGLAGRLYRVEAIWPGETVWSNRLIEADKAEPWPGGALHAYNGNKAKKDTTLVLTLAPGRWRACAPVQ